MSVTSPDDFGIFLEQMRRAREEARAARQGFEGEDSVSAAMRRARQSESPSESNIPAPPPDPEYLDWVERQLRNRRPTRPAGEASPLENTDDFVDRYIRGHAPEVGTEPPYGDPSDPTREYAPPGSRAAWEREDDWVTRQVTGRGSATEPARRRYDDSRSVIPEDMTPEEYANYMAILASRYDSEATSRPEGYGQYGRTPVWPEVQRGEGPSPRDIVIGGSALDDLSSDPELGRDMTRTRGGDIKTPSHYRR